MMRSRFSTLPRTTPEVHEAALQIAVTCRIVVAGVLEPRLLAEAEKRFYLSARGVLEQLREERPPRGPDTQRHLVPNGDAP